MFKYLMRLELKEFLRSKRFSKRLVSMILLGLFFLYLVLNAVVLGFGLYYGLKETKQDVDVFALVNNYLVYFFSAFFLMLIIMANIPSMKVKPLMILPISKRTVLVYFLFKLIFNFFFFVPLILFISFSAALITDGYDWIKVAIWFFSMMSIVVIIQYLNFLIEKSYKIVFSIVLFVAGVFALKKFGLIDIPTFFGKLFYSIYENPLYLIVILLFFVFVSMYLYNILRSQFYVDGAVRPERKKSTELKLSWLDRFGTMANFLKNDIRMIWRNKRPRRTFFWSFYFLFYGAYLLGAKHSGNPTSFNLVFACMFITSGFLFSFGNFVPSWDSEYYRLLMSQNIKYEEYIDSKWWLMVASVVLFSILSIPFIYFGTEVLQLIYAMAVFNIGFNSYLVLIGGLFNDRPIKLNEKVKSFQNTKGFNWNSFLIGLIRLLFPILIFILTKKIGGQRLAIFILLIFGLLGLALKKRILHYISGLYVKRKYKLLEAFAKEE